LKNNLPEGVALDMLDLNLEFHRLRFSEYGDYFRALKKDYDPVDYIKTVKEYQELTREVYAHSNKLVVEGKRPEDFDSMLSKIVSRKPDIVAFSLVYSSQCFFTLSLIEELKKKGIKTIIGGPASNPKLVDIADAALKNELELLEYVAGSKIDHDSLDCNTIPDFTVHDLEEYFTPRPVIPIRTSSSCYYKQCAFCTHHQNAHYFEFPIETIKAIIVKSRQKYFFLIDDMIHKKRLLEFAAAVKPLNIIWTCQLRPTTDLDLETLKILYDSGLKVIVWGVESASDRVLKLIRKGTEKAGIKKVLSDSHSAGITNAVYIIFGFPTETKEELIETITFLTDNSDIVDMVLPSIFGLQKGSYVYEHPQEFGITKITEEKRTVLEPTITYEVSQGLTNAQATVMKKKYKVTLERLNKYPKEMNFFREHMLYLIS